MKLGFPGSLLHCSSTDALYRWERIGMSLLPKIPNFVVDVFKLAVSL